MMNKLRKKMHQRGVAMIEYAILLSFVAVISVSFISSNGMAKPINSIIKNVNRILTGEHSANFSKFDSIYEAFKADALEGSPLWKNDGKSYECGYLAYSDGTALEQENCKKFLEAMGVNDITNITGTDVKPDYWSVNTKGSTWNKDQTDSVNWKEEGSKYFMSYDKNTEKYSVYFDQNGRMDRTTTSIIKGVTYDEAVEKYKELNGK